MITTKKIIGASVVILVLLILYWFSALIPVIATLPGDVIVLILVLIGLVTFGLFRILTPLLRG